MSEHTPPVALARGGRDVWYRFEDRLVGHPLLHTAEGPCPYAVEPERLPQTYDSDKAAVDAFGEDIRAGRLAFCPVCMKKGVFHSLAWDEKAERRAEAISGALLSGKCRREWFLPEEGGDKCGNPDRREYFGNIIDLERIIRLGSDSRVRDMRMEYYTMAIARDAVIFTVAVNSIDPLPIGEEMTVWCNCTVCVQQKKGLLGDKWTDIITEGMRPTPLKRAEIHPRDDYPYDGAHGYFLKFVFSGDELCARPTPGYYNVKFDLETAMYLRKGRVLFNRFQLDELEYY